MRWHEVRHAFWDLVRGRGWYGTYAYTRWRPLQAVEWRLRERSCRKRGHNFPGGEDGKFARETWKHFCVTCHAPAPYEWRG